MSFKIAKEFAPYRYPVTVEKVREDGSRSKDSFTAQFKRLRAQELDSLVKRTVAGTVSDADAVREVLIGWFKVTDEDGAEVEFNVATLNEALEDHAFARDTVLAFLESVGKARGKN